MEITKEWLSENNACAEARVWVGQQDTRDSAELVRRLIEHNLEWGNWGLTRLLGRVGKIKYAIFAAEQVLAIYEKKHPNDKRPRSAIEAARKVLENDTDKNRAASDAASAAASSAYAAFAYAASASASDAASASASAKKEMQIKIIEYGLGILEQENACTTQENVV